MKHVYETKQFFQQQNRMFTYVGPIDIKLQGTMVFFIMVCILSCKRLTCSPVNIFYRIRPALADNPHTLTKQYASCAQSSEIVKRIIHCTELSNRLSKNEVYMYFNNFPLGFSLSLFFEFVCISFESRLYNFLPAFTLSL